MVFPVFVLVSKLCFNNPGCSIRYASGIVAEYQFSEGTLNETMIDDLNITQGFNNCTDRECSFGLIPSQQMIEVRIHLKWKNRRPLLLAVLIFGRRKNRE